MPEQSFQFRQLPSVRSAMRSLRTRLLGGVLSREQIVTALYRGLLGREPDPEGMATYVEHLDSGIALEAGLRAFVDSAEFRARMMAALVPRVELPDLTRSMPDRYERVDVNGAAMTVFRGESDEDVALMQSLIEQHRYYDRFDVWSPVIDPDKEVTASIVLGLGARSCFELGCFTGPVLSLLAEAGLAVRGSEVSHHALAFAYPSVRDDILFGDVLSLDFRRRFDVVLCMDVLEHLSPLQLDEYLARLVSLMEADGYLYLNSPMWGPDPVFGVVSDPFLDEWRRVGDASFWRHWPCDEKGWPEHGHLVWASPSWWTAKFAAHGLIRDIPLEQTIHRCLAAFFAKAPSRRSLFVLRRAECGQSSASLASALDASLSQCAGLIPLNGAATQPQS